MLLRLRSVCVPVYCISWSFSFCSCLQVEVQRKEQRWRTGGWSRNKWRLIQWWGQQPCHCRFTSGTPPFFLTKWSHGRIGVSHASSVATQSLFYPSFPQNKLLSSLCLSTYLSSLWLLIQIICTHFVLTSINISPHLMHLLWVLPPHLLCLLVE